MCGRYSLAPGEFSEIRLAFKLDWLPEFSPRYNIAPTSAPGYEVPIVTAKPPPGAAEASRQAVLARWWFIPRWWEKPLSELPTAFNAAIEGLDKKRFFREALSGRRCLVPATGWREFQGPPGKKQGYQFHYGGRLFAFAGLWDEWVSPEGEVVTSFSIVTGPADDVVRPIHDRRPLVVGERWYSDWLNPSIDGKEALARVLEHPVPGLDYHPTKKVGNSTRAEGPECIEPDEPEPPKGPVQGSLF